MKTIAVIAEKGGCGKTTIATALSVRAAKDFGMVAMLDMNADQANLTQWYQLRGAFPENPALFTDIDDLAADLPRLARNAWDVCVIDTPPSYADVIETCVMVADAVIVPVKVSIFDAGSLAPVIEMCKARRKPFGLVLSDVDQRFKTQIAEVKAHLQDEGLPLLPCMVSHLQSYQVAPNLGKTGPEIDKKAAEEIDALWREAKRLAGMDAKRKGGRQ
jgi:chromosome partitioning protein